jgi:transcriptional regulator with XRE-family HTH domain
VVKKELMGADDTPVVARRRVRLALRDAREARGYTQGQVAEAMEWSLSKVMRIEKGEVNISPGDLRALLDHLEVNDPGEVGRLLEDVRRARAERWTVDRGYREHLTAPMLQFMQYERDATCFRYFNPVLLPAAFQTVRYATAVLGVVVGGFPEDAVTTRIKARMERRHQLVTRTRPPRCLTILDESVLCREVGGPEVMGEQLLELLRLMEYSNIFVRILPFTEPLPIALLGPFNILDMGDGHDAVLYREGPRSDEIVTSRREILNYRDTFERMWAGVYGDEDSARLIEKRAEAMLANASRRRSPS